MTAGVYVSNIQRVDRTTNSFDADFYIWLRWTNPDIDPTSGIEIMNLYQSWALTVTPQYDEPRLQPTAAKSGWLDTRAPSMPQCHWRTIRSKGRR